MDKSLSDRLKALIERTEIDRDPLLVADSARLLSEVQQWEEKGGRLDNRVSALERHGHSPAGSGPGKSLADWAYAVLSDDGGPMPYREIAAVIKARGFTHAREPKNPEKQLADSVWSAMYEDERFEKVGRGIFDLTERL
jgi:HB1, ASXL, restriction endonuclease HTH domain